MGRDTGAARGILGFERPEQPEYLHQDYHSWCTSLAASISIGILPGFHQSTDLADITNLDFSVVVPKHLDQVVLEYLRLDERLWTPIQVAPEPIAQKILEDQIRLSLAGQALKSSSIATSIIPAALYPSSADASWATGISQFRHSFSNTKFGWLKELFRQLFLRDIGTTKAAINSAEEGISISGRAHRKFRRAAQAVCNRLKKTFPTRAPVELQSSSAQFWRQQKSGGDSYDDALSKVIAVNFCAIADRLAHQIWKVRFTS